MYSDADKDWIYLFVEKAETTKMVEAEWNMKVWKNGKQLLDHDFKHTFDAVF